MTPLTRLTAIAAPLLRDNIDTDVIIPSREIRTTGRTGLADGLFAGWRYRHPGRRDPDPDFILNRSSFSTAQILLAGANFGCGSSREHAVWALAEFGIRVVVAPSFAPIFAGNCVRNGVLPAVLPANAVEEIAAVVMVDPLAHPLTVDVGERTVSLPDGRYWPFPLEEDARTMLMEGLDAIDVTLKHRAAIAAFHERDRADRPWVYLSSAP